MRHFQLSYLPFSRQKKLPGLPDLHPLRTWTLVRFQLPSRDLPRWAWRSHPTVLLLWLRPEAFAAATGCPLRPQEPKWHRCNTPKQLKFVEGERGALRYVKGHDELNL